MRLRSGLLVIVGATSVPLLAFALLAVIVVSQREEQTLVNAALARNRATLTTADAELTGVAGVLRALSGAASLRRGDLASFHADAKAVLETQPHWQTIQLQDTAGHPLLDASVPWGTPLPREVVEKDSYNAVVRSKAPSYGGYLFSPRPDKEPGIAVRIPLLKDGELTNVLTAVVRPTVFQKMLEAQKLPPDWFSGLVGADGRMIARVPSVPPGTMASEDYRRHIASGPEGWYRGKTLEGADTFTAYARSPLTGWTIGYAFPSAMVVGSALRAAMVMLGGLCVALLVAGGLALLLMRRVTQPIAQLEQQAKTLEAGGTAEPLETWIDEVAQVSAALASASKAVAERDAELRATRDELRQRLEELQEVSANKSTFVAQLSHELRNPISPLVTGIALLKARSDGQGSTAQTLAMMERQVRQMIRLVDDLLDMSRIERGTVELRQVPMDLRDAVSSALEACRPLIEAKNQVLSTDLAATAIHVVGDAQRLAQVVSNMLSNAAKYTPVGGAIEVSAFSRDGLGVVSVKDSGAGFDPALGERLFEMFTRAPGEGGSDPGGLGIGLSIARALTHAHGGRIEAHSDGPGKGARFSFYLPAVNLANMPSLL